MCGYRAVSPLEHRLIVPIPRRCTNDIISFLYPQRCIVTASCQSSRFQMPLLPFAAKFGVCEKVGGKKARKPVGLKQNRREWAAPRNQMPKPSHTCAPLGSAAAWSRPSKITRIFLASSQFHDDSVFSRISAGA